MNFLRTKAIFIVITVMALLCIYSIGTSLRITISMFDKKDQPGADAPANGLYTSISPEKLVNISKLKLQDFFFNGSRFSDGDTFFTDKKQLMVPIDVIFNKLGISFKFYNSDDLFESKVNGKKLAIKAGSDKFSFGGQDIYLNSVPVIAKDHILVPSELVSYIGLADLNGFPESNLAFMNYYPDYKENPDNEVRVVRLLKDKLAITGMSGKNIIWSPKDGSALSDSVEFSKDNKVMLIKSRAKCFIFKLENGQASPKTIDAPENTNLSLDGKYIYWLDRYEETAFLLNLETGNTAEVPGSYFNIGSEYSSSQMEISKYSLYTYEEKGRSRCIIFEKPTGGKKTAYIEYKKALIFKGDVLLSPSGKKILYHVPDAGYKIANLNGSEAETLFDGTNAWWVSDTKLMMKDKKGMYFVDTIGFQKLSPPNEWHFSGFNPDGTPLYFSGNTIYTEAKGKSKIVTKLPFSIGYLHTKSPAGPYTIVSSGQAGDIYFISGDKNVRLGKKELLLRKNMNGVESIDYEKSVTTSPKGEFTAVLQEEKGLLSIHFVNTKSLILRQVLLNCPVEDAGSSAFINLKWLSDTRLVISSLKYIWVIDIKDDVKIYEQKEPEGSAIYKMLP